MLLFLLFTLIILIFARKRLFRIEEGMFMRFHILLALLIGRHSLYHKEHDKGDHKQQYRYYHIDKIKGCIVELSDLAVDDSFYSKLKAEVQRQMKVEMDADKDIKYWLEDDPFGVYYLEPGENGNFYWNDDGDLVIVFNKYDAAPGFMGTPEFTVKKSVLGDSLVPEYR